MCIWSPKLVVMVLNLKFSCHMFKYYTDHSLELFHSRLEFSGLIMFVNSGQICYLAVGVLNLVFHLNYLFLKFDCFAPVVFGTDQG